MPLTAKHRPTVCHVLLSLEVGGAEVLASQFAHAMRDDLRAVFACLDRAGTIGERLRREGFAVQELGRTPGIDLRCASRLRRWLCEQNVRLVHAHQYTPFFYSSLARTGLRVPVLFTEHGRHHPDVRSARRVLANRVLLRGSDRVVAVGEQVRQALVANEGFAPDRVTVIPNGVSAEKFRPDAVDRRAVRRALGFADEHELLMQVARLNPLKDHATAIRAIALLRDSRPQLRLLIVGDGELREELQRLAASLQLESHVCFLGSRDDVDQLLPAADAFLLSSVSEGTPLTLIEAMLSGVPVVATRVGSIPEVVEDGRDGLLARPGDAADIAACLDRLLNDAALGRQLALAGRERAQRLFGAPAMIAKYERLYREMLPVSNWEVAPQSASAHFAGDPALSTSLTMAPREAV